MRTTVTLDADTEAAVRALMARRRISFKQALNDAIRAGVVERPATGPVTWPRRMGVPLVELDKAMQLAGELDDAELIARMSTQR